MENQDQNYNFFEFNIPSAAQVSNLVDDYAALILKVIALSVTVSTACIAGLMEIRNVSKETDK